jgi:predicted nucleic acid-binding protein
MIVVSNTTPLIGLAAIQRLDLLRDIFGKVHIAEAVHQEAISIEAELAAVDWIEIVKIKDQLAVDVLLDELDLGEAETIILARELGADWVLMDEKKGRRKLTQLGLSKIGTVGILLKAKQLGLLAIIQPDLEKLRHQGFSISQPVIDALLKQAGE